MASIARAIESTFIRNDRCLSRQPFHTVRSADTFGIADSVFLPVLMVCVLRVQPSSFSLIISTLGRRHSSLGLQPSQRGIYRLALFAHELGQVGSLDGAVQLAHTGIDYICRFHIVRVVAVAEELDGDGSTGFGVGQCMVMAGQRIFPVGNTVC